MGENKLQNLPLRIRLLLLSLVGIGASAYYMLTHPFWGYWPLLLLVSGWAIVLLITAPRFSTLNHKHRLFALATLSGGLLSLGFPDLPFTPFMFIGFVPLLMVVREIEAQRPGVASKWEVFKFSYHAFVTWNILTTYWVMNTAFVAAIVAIGINALFMSVPIVLYHQTRVSLKNNRLAFLAFLAYWISFEYLHLRWELTWPWLTLGNSFAEYPSWVQWYEYTGVFGGSLWILLVNLWVFRLVSSLYYDKERVGKASVAGLLTILVSPILVSLWVYHNYEDKGRAVEVVVVQPNYEPHYDKFSIPQRVQFDQYIRLSEQAITDETEYLVFPETSFGGINVEAFNKSGTMLQLMQFAEKYPKLKIVTGLSAFKIFEEGEPHTRAVRTHVNERKDTTYWEAYNASVQIQKGEEIPVYIKSKLVPGAEILPYKEVFFFLEPLVNSLDGSLSGHGIQEERTVFKNEGGKPIGTAICYESVFGEYYTGYIRKGANAMFIITNDGWWDNTAGHRQHLKFASLRAIETRRSIARSANTGISAFINQRGDILKPTAYEEAAVIKDNLPLNGEITFYVYWGDMIGRLFVFAAIILLLNTFVKSITDK